MLKCRRKFIAKPDKSGTKIRQIDRRGLSCVTTLHHVLMSSVHYVSILARYFLCKILRIENFRTQKCRP